MSRTLDWKQGGKRDEKEGQKELAMEVRVERVIDRRRKKKKGWPSTEKKNPKKKKTTAPLFLFFDSGNRATTTRHMFTKNEREK